MAEGRDRPNRSSGRGPVWAQTEEIHFGDYHALVIGNNDYQNVGKLKTAIADASTVADVLKNQYGFRVTLLTNATRDNVLRALAQFRRNLKPNDNLLLYYAGHGVLDEVGDRGYWLPVNADADVRTNWIANDDITTELKAIRAKHVMVVSDSCYSGTLADTRATPVDFDSLKGSQGWIKRIVKKRTRMALASPVIHGAKLGHANGGYCPTVSG